MRQAGLILSMGALSFVLGFFVLSRFVPTGHGPDSPTPTPAGDNDGSSRSDQVASGALASRERHDPPASRPTAPAANTPGPTIDPAPSIDPTEEGPTQKPASIDDASDEKKSTDAERQAADENKNTSDATQGNSRESGGIRSAADGQRQSDTPTPPRRRRRRRSAPPAAASTTEKQPVDANITQRASSLDDSGDNKSDQTDKSGQGDKGDGDDNN